MKTIQFIRRQVSLSVVLIGVLAVLLPLLAFLQYRWIGQVSASARERLEENLMVATRRFTGDFSREFSRVAVSFQLRPGMGLDLESQLARNYEQWQATSPHPELVERVFLADMAEAGSPRLRQFIESSGAFEDVSWPAELEDVKARLDRAFEFYGQRFGFDPRPRERGAPPEGDAVWLLVPLLAGGPRPAPLGLPFQVPGWALVEIDAAYLWSELVPETVATHFDLRDYIVSVFRPEEPRRILYASGGALSRTEGSEPDARIELHGPFSARRGSEGQRWNGRDPGGREPVEGVFLRLRRGGFGPGSPPFLLLGGSWELAATHRSGSLETAVAALRRRNMGIGFGILALLGISGAMIVVWAERVRALGRLQMEFAAGISHELRTPLTVIRTAAHNISSGVIQRPEEVREYAAMVQTEGRRLSTMVEQIIQFAQTESGRRRYDLIPVDIRPVIDRAVGAVFATPEEAGSKVQLRIDPGLPPALADPIALAHALGNLLSNAGKYGSTAEPISIEAGYNRRSDWIELSVRDRGPGIGPGDLPHVFEPFYRGKSAGDVPGSGLGLNLVRRMMEGQQGRVTVSSRPGSGATFTLHIPAAPAQVEARHSDK